MMESTAVSTDIKHLTNNLRMRVEREVCSMSNESIVVIENILAEVTVTLRASRNSRLPLFHLPVEILQQILENVASPLSEIHNDFTPFWRSHAMATSMLLPTLRTCRQLRQVAISHAILWRTVSSSSQYRLPALPLYGADIPLVAIINGCDRDSLLSQSESIDASRIQELHIFNLRNFRDRNDVAALRRHILPAKLSCLECLSVSAVTTNSSEEEPISLDEAPRLKRMALQSVTFLPRSTFPYLTHLAVGDVYVRNHHSIIADLLSRCPNLESLAINSLQVTHWQSIIIPEPFSQPLALPHLRRVAIQVPLGSLARFYLSLFPTRTCRQDVPIALEILNYHMEDLSLRLGTLLMQTTRGAATHLSLSMTPILSRASSDQVFIAISAAGPLGTFHVTSNSFYGRNHSNTGYWDHFCGSFVNSVLDGGAHLAAVREVWITGRHPDTERHPHIAAAFRSTIAALPALETVVLVVSTESGLCFQPEPAAPSGKTSHDIRRYISLISVFSGLV